jgi:hypothetical protein
MKIKLFFCLIAGFVLANTATAQLGGLLKKKKDKEEKTEVAAAKTDSIPNKEEEKEEKKKSGGGFFQKVVGKVAKAAGGVAGGMSGMVGTADNLDNVDVVASVGTNIYSKDLGLMFTDFLGKEWINNGDFSMLQLASKDAFKLYKYAGIIKVNGKELKHAAMGVYTVTENPGSGNKKISFEKNGVVEGSFEIPLPAKNIKLVSVNAQTKNIKVDLTKDVQLELANYPTDANSLIRVDVITTQIGIRTLSMVAYVKPAATVTIPAAAFRNIENTNNFNFKNCYLSVSEQQLVKTMNNSGNIPVNQTAITGSNDGMWIDVSNSNANNKGIKFETGSASVEKKNAAFAMPLSFAKNVAVSSFYTYGTTQLYDQKTNNWTKTETTKSIDFPQIPDAYLDAMLEDMYTKFTATLTTVAGSSILPVTTVPKAPSYANTIKFMPGEVNNEGEFLKVYKELNPVKTQSSVSNMYYGESALLKDVRADALLKVSLACALSWDKKPTMTPYLTIELIGISNGDFRSFMGNTKYFTINIKGNDYELKKNKPVEFDKVFQVNEFNEQFKKALQELKIKEDANGDYEKVWSLQK